MTDDSDTTDIPEEDGPVGKPSQAEGEDPTPSEDHTPQPTGKPSQAEGDDSGQL
jgi:hypothetical protein